MKKKEFNFLEDKLSRLQIGFPNINIKFCYNYYVDSIIIKIEPKAEFDNNEALDDILMQIDDEFENKFPLRDLTFVSSGTRLLDGMEVHELEAPNTKRGLGNIISLNDFALNEFISEMYANLEGWSELNMYLSDKIDMTKDTINEFHKFELEDITGYFEILEEGIHQQSIISENCEFQLMHSTTITSLAA